MVLSVSLFAFAVASCAGTRPPPALPVWVQQTASRVGGPGPAGAGRQPRAPAIPRPHAGSARGRDPAADLVVAALQDEGIEFGTDGSMAALWGYLRSTHREVAPGDAQPGDVVFFQLHPERRRDCDSPDHAGLVVDASADGRLSFIERRGGQTRRSFVDPAMPDTRRDADGHIHNTFLRTARLGDAEDAPLYAGEMFCAAIRPIR